MILKGIVQKGEQLARTLGIPTINMLILDTNIELKNGVHSGLFRYNKNEYPSCIYIHPSKKVEIHILNKTEFVIEYGEEIECECLKFVRDVLSFDNLTLQEIKNQLQIDIRNCN